MREKCDDLEQQTLENFHVTVENRKREEKLYERVHTLEEQNKTLMKELKRMMVKQANT